MGGTGPFVFMGLNFLVFEEIWRVCTFEKISETLSRIGG